jgi:peptidoglycan/xylan/chitin deacetylase (PgdA/CDA1 family)
MASKRAAAITTLGSAVVKHAAINTDRLRRPPSGITMLLYHRVGAETGSIVDLDVITFRAQLDWLTRSARLLSLDGALAELAAPFADGRSEEPGLPASPSSPPAVVVTFDDGTIDFMQHVLPALVDYQVPTTLYVATRHVEEREPWPDGCPSVSWQGLAECRSTGLVTIGCHSHGHVLLDRCPPQHAAEDLDTSIGLLQSRLGLDPVHFAYPKAVTPSPGCEAEVRARFRSAALAGNRPNPVGTNPHRLWRTPIQTTDSHRFFCAKARGGMRLEASARQAANRWRYRRSDA